MLTQSQLALDTLSSAREAQHPLPEVLTQPGEGNAGTSSFALSPSTSGSSFCAALTIRGGGKEGRKRLASGRRGNRATHEDAGLRESQGKPRGSHCVRRKFEQSWGLRKKWGKGSGQPHEHKGKEEERKNPRMESELGRDTEEARSSWEQFQVLIQIRSSNLFDSEKCPVINPSMWSLVCRNFL